MIAGAPLGIYFLLYSKTGLRCHAMCIVACTKDELLDQLIEQEIPDDYVGYLEECKTPEKLVRGTVKEIREWAEKHMPDNYGDPLIYPTDNPSPPVKTKSRKKAKDDKNSTPG